MAKTESHHSAPYGVSKNTYHFPAQVSLRPRKKQNIQHTHNNTYNVPNANLSSPPFPLCPTLFATPLHLCPSFSPHLGHVSNSTIGPEAPQDVRLQDLERGKETRQTERGQERASTRERGEGGGGGGGAGRGGRGGERGKERSIESESERVIYFGKVVLHRRE